jgi:protein-S-isoprenylcysteine O-methyltransferase Ste14
LRKLPFSPQAVNIFVVVRAVVYAALFIGFVLVYLPGRFLSWSGIAEPATTGASQVAGMIMVTTGTVTALWCVFTFVFIGKGTPAPFDPPTRLVIRGPYRFVRNPMYIGAGMTLAGAALYYQSLSILIYTGVFFLITHLFVVLYEEPTLRRTFGAEYEAYCSRVKRWIPKRSTKEENLLRGKESMRGHRTP